MVLKLSQIIDDLSAQNQCNHLYIKQDGGEIIGIREETIKQYENLNTVGWENYQDWEKEEIRLVEKVYTNENYLRLPTPNEIHEYQIMEDFCESIQDDQLQWNLQRAIQGKGAFQRFKQLVYQNGIEEDWYAYKLKTLEKEARVWLEENQIPFIDDLLEKNE